MTPRRENGAGEVDGEERHLPPHLTSVAPPPGGVHGPHLRRARRWGETGEQGGAWPREDLEVQPIVDFRPCPRPRPWAPPPRAAAGVVREQGHGRVGEQRHITAPKLVHAAIGEQRRGHDHADTIEVAAEGEGEAGEEGAGDAAWGRDEPSSAAMGRGRASRTSSRRPGQRDRPR
jgi:hypothetical protein